MNTKNEVWKDVKGYKGLYQVSSLGRVKSVERVITLSDGRPKTIKEWILRPANVRGYLQVGLCKNGVMKICKVHRLVAEAFIPNDDISATTVNHKDENKTNNRVDNLEWMSSGDNVRYSSKEGGSRCFKGSRHPRARQVRCVETGQVFGYAREASMWLGLSIRAVDDAIRIGCRCGGYHWEYIN